MVATGKRGVSVDDVLVECRPDARGESVPRRFGWRGAMREVVEVVDRWPGEGHRYFRVRDDTGAVLILRHDTARDAWRLVFFESGGPG
jgi:hypothetical protein